MTEQSSRKPSRSLRPFWCSHRPGKKSEKLCWWNTDTINSGFCETLTSLSIRVLGWNPRAWHPSLIPQVSLVPRCGEVSQVFVVVFVCLLACFFHEIWHGWRHWSGWIECFCFCFSLLFPHTCTRMTDSREERARDDVPFVQHHVRALW